MVIANKKDIEIKVGDFIFFENGGVCRFAYEQGEKYPYHLIDMYKSSVLSSWDELPSKKELEREILPISQIISQKNAKIEIS